MERDTPKNDPMPTPRSSRAPKAASSWDCMDCIVIEEELDLELRETGEGPDKYWEQAWSFNICGVHRSDFSADENARYHRVYPTRYIVPQFEITRSMRRVLARNSDIKVVIRPLRITPAKEDLFLAHHLQRWGFVPEAPLNERFKYQTSHQVPLMEASYFLDDALVAFSIFEVGEYSMWSSLGVWSPVHARRSLGTLTILKEIEYGRANGFLYYYMGHYWPGNPDYEYKTRFRPLELWDWDDQCWRDFDSPVTWSMLTERLQRRSNQ